MKESINIKDVFAITEREAHQEGGSNRWIRIGIAFMNRDNSINVVLDLLPLNGRLHIRDRQITKIRNDMTQSHTTQSQRRMP